jgi:hypothetical protein
MENPVKGCAQCAALEKRVRALEIRLGEHERCTATSLQRVNGGAQHAVKLLRDDVESVAETLASFLKGSLRPARPTDDAVCFSRLFGADPDFNSIMEGG